MASFPPVTMTTEGLNMIAKASSGNSQDRLIITKVKLGDGVSEGNIRDYTDVISSKKEVTLAEWEDRGDGRFRYTFIYNNEGVKTGFYHREIGLFAKNGDSGTEKLIAYSNAGSYPGYIDDETKEIPYQRLMINIGVGDTDNVSGQVDASNAVTIEMLNEHDADENAHDNLIKRLFGSATATMESVKTSVQSWCKESIASLLGISSATTDNIKSKIKSWAQEQIESWLETLGIRYNIAQNGYICLGKLFGDAIIQWGSVNATQREAVYALSFSFGGTVVPVGGFGANGDSSGSYISDINDIKNGFNYKIYKKDGTIFTGVAVIKYIAFGW